MAMPGSGETALGVDVRRGVEGPCPALFVPPVRREDRIAALGSCGVDRGDRCGVGRRCGHHPDRRHGADDDCQRGNALIDTCLHVLLLSGSTR